MHRALEQHPAKQCWLLFDAAIPHRTNWRVLRPDGSGYIGLEIGPELFPVADRDEFVVFPARSREE